MLSKNFITIIVRKPAKQGEDYHFSIPREMIGKNVIDPKEFYELRIYKFDEDK